MYHDPYHPTPAELDAVVAARMDELMACAHNTRAGIWDADESPDWDYRVVTLMQDVAALGDLEYSPHLAALARVVDDARGWLEDAVIRDERLRPWRDADR